MEVLATYCSALKVRTKEVLPAKELYQSKRIKSCEEIALNKELPFFILSGKFGFISSSVPIPYYDHLLVKEEVQGHIFLVKDQLEILKIKRIEFYYASIHEDPFILPYLETIQSACNQLEIELELILSEYSD